MYKKIKKNFILFSLLILLFNLTITKAAENKILFKINNEIITSQDISNEIKYLATINKEFLNLEKEKIFEISKNSLIKEKIKKIEILKRIKKIEIKEEYLDKLIETTYSNLGFNSVEKFNKVLEKKNLKIEDIKEKLAINAIWNEIIYIKYSSKIKINEKELKEDVQNIINKKRETFLLSEIVFNVSMGETFEDKYREVKNTILIDGFSNAALKHSISTTAEIGGKLGWINKESVNNLIYKEIKSLNKNEFSKPITISSGFLIIQVNDKKKIKKKLNAEKELKKLIQNKKNYQLGQFSNMYFNKIKKDIFIDEL
jgi:peptidyl-prolyl cis-trans isomerase SurA